MQYRMIQRVWYLMEWYWLELYGNKVDFDGRTVLGYGRIYTKWEIQKTVWWDGPIFFKYPSTDARKSFVSQE